MQRAGRVLSFSGRIAGVGSTSGVRVVVGRWERSPYGAFSDVMLADPDGTRHLLAPSEEVVELVSSTYSFDRVTIGAVSVTDEGESWCVEAPDLSVRLTVGARPPLGRLLRLVPRRLATSPGWTLVTDPVARMTQRGVRTRGSAGGGRREYYGAVDLHRITDLEGSWHGADLGSLALVLPDPGFGFGSTPSAPAVTALVTTIVEE